MTKNLLCDIIAKMEDNGFIIHGVSFDCGNSTLIKECGMARMGNFSFANPRDPTRNVYLFPGMFSFILTKLQAINSLTISPQQNNYNRILAPRS